MAALITATALMPGMTEAANPITSLIKPGDVIAGHAEFEDDCKACHAKFHRDDQSHLCRDCHEDVDADMVEKTGFHGLSAEVRVQQCRDCHTDHEGRNAQIAAFDPKAFQHSLTDFPLFGAHSGKDCELCHADGEKFRDAPGLCFDCHREDDHHNGELGEDCAECHTPRDWLEARFDHSTTDWPLEGEHETAECESCHEGGHYKDTPTDCIACHREDDEHKGQFGRECDTCHVPLGFERSVFDHARDTGYALEGGHRKVECTACHTEHLYEVKLQTECQSCHADDDVHEGLRGSACETCHVVQSWEETDFDHLRIGGFELLGKHSTAECDACHKEPADEVDLPEECIGCHREDDPHDGQEGEQCANCHNERGWDVEVVFDHSLTDFPLLGRHEEVECDECHQSKEFKNAPGECFDCHEEDDYHAGSLGTACADCHTPADWTVWEFDHARSTDFALTGAHAPLECASCHTDNAGERVAKPPTACYGCHAQDDVHFGEFGRRCERCHVTDNFYETTAVH